MLFWICKDINDLYTLSSALSPSGFPACPRDINVVEGDLCDSVNVTWTSSSSQTSATITYCQVSSQGSCMSVVCSSSPCTIQGVRRDREYEYTVLPTNNCGSPSGCTGNAFTFALGEFCGTITFRISIMCMHIQFQICLSCTYEVFLAIGHFFIIISHLYLMKACAYL